MGTNFYLEPDAPCLCCGRPFDREHIGKNSGGWVFLWQSSKHKTFADWDRTLRGAQDNHPNKKPIVDEYGNEYSYDEFMTRINHPAPGLMNLSVYGKMQGVDYSDSGEKIDADGWRFCDSEFS